MATEWKEVCIADLGEVIGGATPSTKNASFYGGDIAWITPKDLSNFNERYISRGERNITELGKQSCSTKLLPKNSVLFTSRAPIGYVAIAENELCTNQGFKSIIPNDNTDYLFLFYLLKYNKNKIEAMGSGTTFKEVSARVMQSIKLRVPDKETQQKIAKILSALDEKIELNNKINENLHAQAQAIFKSWFVDFEPFGGTMPNDWEKGKLSDVADIIMGQSPKGESYNEIGDGEVFYQGKADFTERFPVRRLYTTEPKRMAEEKSVLLSVRAPVGEINVATEKCCIGRGLASIKSKKGQNSYLLYLLYSIQSQFDIFNGEGTVFGSINKSDLGNMNIVLPAQEKISQFEKIASQLDEMILTNWNENQKLAQIRDTLLSKLMSGELEV